MDIAQYTNDEKKIYTNMENITFADERLTTHLNMCNEILCNGHRIEKSYLFNYKIGQIVTTLNAYPRNIIGIVYGYIYSPFTNSYRVVLGEDFDVEIDNVRLSNRVEQMAFNVYTNDLQPVETRYTKFIE